jgi:cytochrome c-type biogenesis protein CcmF
MIIIPWVYEELKALWRPVNEDLMDATRIGVFSVLAVMTWILSLHEIFSPTPADWLARSPEGNGLSPLLQTDLMVIHPPVVFIAYGFIVVPFAAALAHMVLGHKDWYRLSVNWSRISWLFLTAGLGIGALWAYVVLGWGGYWAWDPVETSSLLPWLLLTGFLHALLRHKRRGEYPILAPVLGALSFVLVIFATFATRAGDLWVSVHTFGQADTSKEPLQRFMDMLRDSDTVRIYFWFIVALIVVTAVLAYFRYRSVRKDKEERSYTLAELMSDEVLMMVTIFLFLLTTLITLITLIGGVNGLSPDNFNNQYAFLSIIGLMVLLACLVWRDLGRKRVGIIAGIGLLAALFGFIAFPDNRIAAATLPVFGIALVGVLYKVIKSINMKRPMASLGLLSAHLIHLSVVLIVIGYVGSNFLGEEEQLNLIVGGDGEKLGAYTLKATHVDSSSTHIFVDVEVWKEGVLVGKARPGAQVIQGEVRGEVRVVDTAYEDVYLTYNAASTVGGDTLIEMNAKTLPLMKVLWGGMWLMMIGILLRISVEKLKRRRRPTVVEDEEEYDEDEEEYDEDEEEYDEDEEEYDEDEDYYTEGEEDEDEVEDEEGEDVEEEGEGEEEVEDDQYYQDLLDKELSKMD